SCSSEAGTSTAHGLLQVPRRVQQDRGAQSGAGGGGSGGGKQRQSWAGRRGGIEGAWNRGGGVRLFPGFAGEGAANRSARRAFAHGGGRLTYGRARCATRRPGDGPRVYLAIQRRRRDRGTRDDCARAAAPGTRARRGFRGGRRRWPDRRDWIVPEGGLAAGRRHRVLAGDQPGAGGAAGGRGGWPTRGGGD